MRKIKTWIASMFRDDLEIQHRLLNLILFAAFAGGLISLLITFLLGVGAFGVFSVAATIALVGISLWVSNKKKRPQLAAILTITGVNMILFPLMYFYSGGMRSGMPIWLVLGLIFSWLLLKGKICFLMYFLNALAAVGCILIELTYPELIRELDSDTIMATDIVQSMLVVTCIFGIIFKYQTRIYERQRNQLVKANETKNEFLANMSHEIRTPIHAILGYNEMIMKETRESNTTEYSLNVQAAGRTLLSLVNNILDFTNIDNGNLTLADEPYSTLSLLQDVLIYAENSAKKKGLELKCVVDEMIPQVLSGDAIRLTQILDNLISNAVKYTKEGYVEVRIDWETSSENTGVLGVRITDTGIGMTPEDVKKISESFIRFDNRQTRSIQGIGLGLTIVTRLLYQMQSNLEIESEHDKGSTFSFRLRQKIVDSAPIGKIESGTGLLISVPLPTDEMFVAPEAKILAVDDSETNLDLFKGVLRDTGVQIDTAENGAEALKLLRKNRYHMVFLDHMMPVMDGMEALQKIKEEKLCPDVPIVVLTANAVAGAKEYYLQAGFDEYMTKPIVSRYLLSVVRKYLPIEVTQPHTEITGASFLERLSFLDTATGMVYCCESEDFYKEMLKSYLEHSKYDSLLACYEQEDWDNYRIQVHALKSTSLSIGATTMSEQAKALEMAAKENRLEYIHEHHADVMKGYQKLLKAIRNALEEQPVTKTEAEAVSEEVSDRARILVVDDDTTNLIVAKKILDEMFAVDTARSGKEVLEFLERGVLPDMILLDLHMPDMDGFEVLKRLKEDERWKEIPVIFLTADNDRDAEVRGFREGALDFIIKPFVADIMLQRVKCILNLDALQKNLQHEVAKQVKKAEERREKVERLSEQAMRALAMTIDAKDKYTNGHSTRVAEYSRDIAKRLGKSEKEQNEIYFIGLLHDIGKIGVPDEIINKTSRLNEEEYAIIKTHPLIGAHILDNMSEMAHIAAGAHWHHERYDGKGYPDGLKGEEIPEVARIIGVADAYDAMTSKRSYRGILPQEVVYDEVAKGRGTQFDSKVADVMLQMISEDTEYRMHEW